MRALVLLNALPPFSLGRANHLAQIPEQIRRSAQQEIESIEDDCNNKVLEVQQQLKDRTVEVWSRTGPRA